MLNVITAKFCSGATQTWTEEAWQYDYGQVLQFDGLDLPDAYQVHFSNTPLTGETITQIGGADGVTVPDQYFTGGETIYAWVYLHEGEDDGETVYMVTIPVKKRPQPSDDVPTPVEQSAINQAIAALGVAVDKAETAIAHYPTIINGTWNVWDVDSETWVDTGVQAQGHDGEDGVSPEITVQDITNGHRVTITDATGTTTFDVMDGENGADGISPDVSIQNITNGHRVTITDAGGTHTFDVMDGEPGEPGATGNGIASITKTGTSGLVDTYTITYTNGQTTTFTVTNGSDATVTVDDALSPTSTNPVQNKVITEELNDVKADLSELSEEVDGKIDDVQIDGTTIVTDGIADIPKATSNSLGVVYVQGDGLYLNTYGRIRTDPASLDNIKSGTTSYKPLTASTEHASAFYGLTKAAGVDMASSDNPVGTYTDAAKKAIREMLGIPNMDSELITEVTVTEDSASVVIDTDSNGQPFALRIAKIQLITAASTTGTADNVAAAYKARLTDDTLGAWYDMPTLKMNTSLKSLMTYEFESYNGLFFLRASAAREYGASSNGMTTMYINRMIKALEQIKFSQYNSTSSLIPAGSIIRVFGVRA